MSLAADQIYLSNPRFITVVLDTADAQQAKHLRVLEWSFGKRCSKRERLDQRICCLHLLPGGAATVSTGEGKSRHE
jgi:hypothetical protein